MPDAQTVEDIKELRYWLRLMFFGPEPDDRHVPNAPPGDTDA